MHKQRNNELLNKYISSHFVSVIFFSVMQMSKDVKETLSYNIVN